jgi:hypothetical protein
MNVRMIILGSSMLLSACSTAGARGTLVPKMQITTDLAQFETVSVVVTSDLQLESGRLAEVDEMLLERLGSAGRFQHVLSQRLTPGARADLILRVKVLEMPKGGLQDMTVMSQGVTRFDVELVEAATGRTIGACGVRARSASGGVWSSAGNRSMAGAVNTVVEFVSSG